MITSNSVERRIKKLCTDMRTYDLALKYLHLVRDPSRASVEYACVYVASEQLQNADVLAEEAIEDGDVDEASFWKLVEDTDSDLSIASARGTLAPDGKPVVYRPFERKPDRCKRCVRARQACFVSGRTRNAKGTYKCQSCYALGVKCVRATSRADPPGATPSGIRKKKYGDKNKAKSQDIARSPSISSVSSAGTPLAAKARLAQASQAPAPQQAQFNIAAASAGPSTVLGQHPAASSGPAGMPPSPLSTPRQPAATPTVPAPAIPAAPPSQTRTSRSLATHDAHALRLATFARPLCADLREPTRATRARAALWRVAGPILEVLEGVEDVQARRVAAHLRGRLEGLGPV